MSIRSNQLYGWEPDTLKLQKQVISSPKGSPTPAVASPTAARTVAAIGSQVAPRSAKK
jgi:hypothetical protein